VKPERHGGEVKRAEPDTELHCSPVLRSYAVTTCLREGYGGQAGDSERRRSSAQRRPPPPPGLSKAPFPARPGNRKKLNRSKRRKRSRMGQDQALFDQILPN
jgi:hypothetical protein